MGPPDAESRRPEGAPAKRSANRLTASARSVSDPDVPGWVQRDVIREAENVVGVSALALSALASLTTEQLRAVVWIGLSDDGWSRIYAELDARGEEL